MASKSNTNNQIHFVLFPFLAQGHMIPMIDIAKILARRGLIVTIFTTHKNASRFAPALHRAILSGSQIHIAELPFPYQEAGLPQGCENMDMIPDPSLHPTFFRAATLLHRPAQELFQNLKPRPVCIISDMCFPWTLDIANKFRIPRITFSGFCSFFLTCLAKLVGSDNIFEALESESEYFVVPGLPDRVEFTRNQMWTAQAMSKESEIGGQIAAADRASYGAIVNSFEELEPAYAEEYRKFKKGKAWFVGPVSLCNEGELDKAQRGNNEAVIDGHECLRWLDSRPSGSVVYASMGSICNLVPAQMMELGLALEASNKPFIWAIRVRSGKRKEEFEKLTAEDGFEERVKERGLLIRGWAPQVLILSHPAIGGFLTHCGWNSTIEGICAGVPLITWPLFGDQFGNQKLVEQVLKIGVCVGAELYIKWEDEDKIGVAVKMEDVKRAIERVMDGGEEGKERRKRARELGESAKRAVEEGGSSHHNLSMLIQDIIAQQVNNHT